MVTALINGFAGMLVQGVPPVSKRAPVGRLLLPSLALALLLSWPTTGVSETPRPRPDKVEKALDQAGTNRQELIRALEQTPPAQRDGMELLVANMPSRDLERLSAAFLLENLTLAYRSFQAAPWNKSVPP